jgi:hypothetical protein
MTSPSPLEIKVVFDGTAKPGKRGKTIPAAARRRRPNILIISLVNLLVAGLLCYVIWWPADRFIGERIILNTPLDLDADAAAEAMFPGLASNPPTVDDGEQPPEDEEEPPTITGKTARLVIIVTSFSWLTLSTIACCILALAGGAALGRIGGSTWRRIGVILSCGAVLGLAWAVYDVWSEYGIAYPLDKKRAGMLALVLLSALIGLAIGRAPRGLSRLGAVVLIIAGVGSVVGLFLGKLCGAVEPEYSSLLFLLIVFFVHSIWGWIMFPLASRIER